MYWGNLLARLCYTDHQCIRSLIEASTNLRYPVACPSYNKGKYLSILLLMDH